MEPYDLNKFESFTRDIGLVSNPILTNSTQYITYDRTDTGVFLIDLNFDLTNRRLNIPLIVDKFSSEQINRILDVEFSEFIDITAITSSLINADFVTVQASNTSGSSSGSLMLPNTWPGPVNLITVSATFDYFVYAINNVTYMGNDIEDIAHNAPYNVYFPLNESDLGNLQSLYQTDMYKPIIDMIMVFNDWYIDPRVISYRESPNASSTSTTNGTSSPSGQNTTNNSHTSWV